MTTDLESLWHSHHTRILSYVFLRVRDHDVADDLVSSVYLRALVAIRNGHAANVNATAWLFTIARNLIIDEYRYRSRRETAIDLDALAELPVSALTPHEEAESRLGCERIWRCLDQLSDGQEQAIMLHMECASDTELAARSGLRIDAVKGRLHRGRARLAEMLSEAQP